MFAPSSQSEPSTFKPVNFTKAGVQLGNRLLTNNSNDHHKFESSNNDQQIFPGMANVNVFKFAKYMDWFKESNKSSVIMKMMQKMGYVNGKGLGKYSQGTIEPIKAILRPGRGTIGTYGKENVLSEECKENVSNNEIIIDDDIIIINDTTNSKFTGLRERNLNSSMFTNRPVNIANRKRMSSNCTYNSCDDDIIEVACFINKKKKPVEIINSPYRRLPST